MESPARRPRLRQLVPHPSRPGSMVAFAALPVFLILLTLVWVVASLYPVRPWLPAVFMPRGPSPQEESARLTELAEALASGTPDERRLKMLTLAGETERCPGYASFTVPQLAARLEDPDARVRAATAFALGALGPLAAEALPSLREAQGKGDTQLDHVVSEAIWWIQHGDTFPPSAECAPPPATLSSKIQ